MKNILLQIVNNKKLELDKTKEEKSLNDIIKELDKVVFKSRDFKNAIKGKDQMHLIAELKKASPSKGVFKEDLNIIEYAKMYEESGANAISVLTEQKYFLGNPVFLNQVRSSVSLPLLRKDFIIDTYQIYESRLLGADAILLIAGILTNTELKDFLKLAESLDLDCLVETHNEEELKKALDADSDIIGINNRNLEDFSVTLDTTERLRKMIPDNKIIVSESGINTIDDVNRLKDIGIDAILVGESIITSNDPKQKIKELVETGD